jgi:transposase-like protein
MAQNQGRVGESKDEILGQLPEACRDERAAVEFIEHLRWGETPACPRCGDVNVAQMQDREGGRSKRFLWRCHGCKRQFTVRIGSIFEDSRIPLRIWCHAFWRACASKKGVSALQIKRETGLSYKSALFLMHRIRFAMTDDHGTPRKLRHEVEVDETFVGGKPRHRNLVRDGHYAQRGVWSTKVPVMALVERGGEVRTRQMERVTRENVKAALHELVDRHATIYTDEASHFRWLGRPWYGQHETVNHSAKEYVRGHVTTNTVESFFAILKRGIYGTFHSVSKQHLPRYLGEFEFKYNTRGLDDGARTAVAIQKAEGKRLRYRQPVRSGNPN